MVKIDQTRQKRKRLPTFLLVAFIYAGNDLRSHTLSRAVQSAQRGLTSVFGMGTGGSPAVRSPTSRSSELRAMTLELRPPVRRSSPQTWWLQSSDSSLRSGMTKSLRAESQELIAESRISKIVR